MILAASCCQDGWNRSKCILCKVQSRVVCWCRHLVDRKGQGFRVRSHCAEDLLYACLFPSKSHFPLKLVLSGKSKRFLCHHTWSDLHGGESPPCDSFSVLPSRGKFFQRCRDRQTFCAARGTKMQKSSRGSWGWIWYRDFRLINFYSWWFWVFLSIPYPLWM